jgi:hypothetical protein
MTRRVIAPFVVALAMMAVPASAEQARTSAGSYADPSIADGSAQHDLNAAKRRWRRHGPRSYTYRLRLACFCPPDALQPHTFVVRAGRPVHPPKGSRGVATVPRLFSIVQDAIDKRADGLRVAYRTKGALEEVSVDQYRNTVDDEYAYSVDRFHRLR